MLKVLVFVLIVFAFGYGFSQLADVDGNLVVTIGKQEITVSLMVAAVGVVAAIVAVMLIWWLIKAFLTSPQRVSRFFRARRRDRGYQSLSTGIIAAGAGDNLTARKMLKQADGLLDVTTEPLIKLLDAQATMLEGNHDDARKKFETMLEDPETRILGLRGLYMEAQRLGEKDAQRHYAEKAVELAPQLSWASKAALDLKTADGDWDGAIRLLDKQKSTKQISKEDSNRKRAVLLTALAQSNLEAEPAKAKSAGMEAHKLAQSFAPAAVVAAEAAFRLNETRRGVKVLETTWRKEPHPDIAIAYVNARPGDSAVDRLKRAKRLEELKPNHIESSMIVAQISMEAAEYTKAREAVATVLRNEPRESAFMLMADIEDAETGDQGRVREWLSRAVRAPRDPAWTADGYTSEKWAPVSPISGRIDAFEWKVPVERIGGAMIDNDLDPMQPGDVVAAVAPVLESQPAGEEIADIIEVETIVEADEADTLAENDSTNGVDATEIADPIEEEDAQDDENITQPIPDDPGIAPETEKSDGKRFRLF